MRNELLPLKFRRWKSNELGINFKIYSVVRGGAHVNALLSAQFDPFFGNSEWLGCGMM